MGSDIGWVGGGHGEVSWYLYIHENEALTVSC